MAAQHSQPDIAEIQSLLRGAGLRSTSSRTSVLQRLREAESPMSHAELADQLPPIDFDKATFFRNLTDLTDAGLVVRTELGDHVWRFEVRDQNHTESGNHPHFVCVDCGSVTCLGDVKLASLLRQKTAEVGRVTEILFRGHCTRCQ